MLYLDKYEISSSILTQYNHYGISNDCDSSSANVNKLFFENLSACYSMEGKEEKKKEYHNLNCEGQKNE